MKKLFLLLFSVLAFTSQVRAGVYVAYQPTEPVAISWDGSAWPGVQLDTKDIAAFYTLSKDDVINIRITNVGTGMGFELDYKEGSGWTWTKLESASHTDGVISYTVESDDIANYIKERGLIIKGIYFKILDITVNTPSIDSDIHDGDYTYQTLSNTDTDLGAGTWSPSVDLRYCGYQNLRKDDVLNIAYTVYNENTGTIQLQHNWSKYSDATTFTELTANSNGTLKITIDDDMLSKFTVEGDDRNSAFVIKGAYVTINSVTLTTKKLAGYRPVYIPASGYATFYGASTCALPDGVGAYYVSSTTEESATFTGLSNIPANQGVILKGSKGIYQLYTTTDEAASVVDNKLVGSTSRQQITDASGKYILYNNAGTPEFRTITADTYLDAFKCYLNAPGGGPAKLNIVFAEDENKQGEEPQGETTSIRNMTNTNVNNNVVYNMNGQRVGSNYKGMVIINGKKVIRK